MSKKKQFMELYEPVHGRFERFCKARSYRVCDFNDLMHDTLVIAFEQFEGLRNKQSFLYYLFGIANKVHSNFRRKRRTPTFSEASGLENRMVESNTEESQLDRDELYEALNKIPQDYRDCIILYEISGFTISEIAEIQESTVDAIKKRLSRGRKMLLNELTELRTNTMAS